MSRREVVVVDDSLTVRMDLADAFDAAGFQAIPCATLGEARAALATKTADVLVLDLLLPDGNGVDLLADVRAASWTTPPVVLMLSSATDVRDRGLALANGADEYVGKPYDKGYVIARARELLRARGGVTSGAITVLVIDDSRTFREELRAALEEAGYDVISAESGEEGLRLAAVQRPDAIICDGILPGIDGATVIRRFRLDGALRQVPSLLLTSSEDREAELRALDAGADAFVRKGEGVALVLTRLDAVLRRTTSPATGGTASLLGPKRILAVDDSAAYLEMLGDALRAEGYDVVLAHSGEEALALLVMQSVDCILLDLVMPGLSGYDTCQRIKAVPVVRDVPLVLLTALEGRGAMIEGFSVGADDYVSKSAELDVLKARVRAQLRRKQFEDDNRRSREDLLRRELDAAEARAARELAATRATLVEELERKNQELEAFSYSVSHDLRAPLRAIDGFSQALLEDCAAQLDPTARGYLERVCAAADRMGELIDDLLSLSRVGRADFRRDRADISAIARSAALELRAKDPHRTAVIDVEEGLVADADSRLVRVLFENLLGNAWKFTARVAAPRIQVAAEATPDGSVAYFVRDNGAGFDAAYAQKLFVPFQRLHSEADFPGTGIGLATVQRIVYRHGGRVWADGAVGHGATFYFTFPRRAPG